MKTVTVLLALSFLGLQTTIVARQPSGQSVGMWNDVQALQVGDGLIIKLKDGREVKGKLVSVRDAELVVKSGKTDAALNRENIFQVYQRVPKSRKTAVAIGATVGGGLGVAGGASSGGAGDLSQPASAIITGVAFAGVGALIGWAVGGGKKSVLIYQAQQ